MWYIYDPRLKSQSIKVFIFIHSLSFLQQKIQLKGRNKENKVVQFKCMYFTLRTGTQDPLHRTYLLRSTVSGTERTLLCISLHITFNHDREVHAGETACDDSLHNSDSTSFFVSVQYNLSCSPDVPRVLRQSVLQ